MSKKNKVDGWMEFYKGDFEVDGNIGITKAQARELGIALLVWGQK